MRISTLSRSEDLAAPLVRRLRIQAYDLIHRHNFDLWLPLVKFNCADDADVFPL